MLTELVLALILAPTGGPAPDDEADVADDEADVADDAAGGAERAESAPARGWWSIPPSDPSRFSLVGQFETQLVGLAFGPRIEGLYRPFRATRGGNLRLGVGVFGGPEAFSVPVGVGWRQHFVPHDRLTLELGAGYEQQSFVVPGLAPISRPSFYGEGGFSVRVAKSGWLGAQGNAGWAPFNRPGPTVGIRVGFRWDFGTQSPRG